MSNKVSPSDVGAAWQQVTSVIPVNFALGTAKHESGFDLNSVLDETNGTTSMGLFQINDEEIQQAGGGDPYDLSDACRMFAYLCEQRYNELVAYRSGKYQGPVYPDIWAYLALAHNQGMAAAKLTISKYGMDWARYSRDNANGNVAGIIPYGDDCISGGGFGSLITTSSLIPLLIAGGLAYYILNKGF